MFFVPRNGRNQQGLGLPKREFRAKASLAIRYKAQSDLEVASEISPLDLSDVTYLKAHGHSGFRGGIGHAHPGAWTEVLKDLRFMVQNEHAQSAGRHIKKKTAVCAAGKGKLQEGVGGVGFYKISVLATPVCGHELHGSVTFEF
jgi:hypothetical protein